MAPFVLCAVIALAPLPFGSTQTSVIAAWSGLLAVVAVLGCGGETSTRDVLFSAAFATLAACWAAVVLIQLTPLSVFAPGLIHPIWPETAKMTGRELPGFISAARNQPFLAAGAQIACALAFICGYFVGRNRHFARAMLKAFTISGLAYAVYGIISFIVAPDHVLWMEKVGYRSFLTATFINANTAAVYFGACAVGWLMLLLDSIHGQSSPARRHWREINLRDPSRNTLVCFFSFVVVLSTTFMTGSRLGSALTLVAVGGAGATFYRRSLYSWRAAGMGLLMSLAAALVLLQVLGGRVNQRFDTGGLADEMRFQTYLSTLRMIEDFPWLGTGLGTFRWAFPEYRSSEISVSGIWDRAHSTTLELAAEMGIPLAALVAAGWLLTMLVIARGMINRKRDDILPTVAFWCSLLALLHSQLDFSLQIPGFAIVILTLTGMGLAQSASSGQRRTASVDQTSGLAGKVPLN